MKRTLLPYQRRWVQDAAPFKMIEKSRRIGLSWAEAYNAVMHAAEGAGNVYYQSYDKEMTRGFIDDCAEWAAELDKVAGAVGESVIDLDDKTAVQTFRLRFASGNEILTMTSAPRAFRSKGRPGDLGIIDEAAFVDDLEEVLKAALAFLTWGGRIHLVSTHNGEASPFNLLLRDVRDGRQPGSVHTVTFSDAIRDGLCRRVFEVSGRDWTPEAEAQWEADIRRTYGHRGGEELDCIPAAGTGAWLAWAVIRAAEHEKAGKPGEWTGQPCYIGVDVARRRDLFVAVAVEKLGDVLWEREMQVRQGVPFAEQRAIVRDMAARFRASRIAVDQTGMGEAFVEQLQDELGRNRVEGVLMTAPRQLDIATVLREEFEDRRIRIHAHEDLRRDLHAVRAEEGPTGAPRLASDRSNTDGHADRFWALALAAAAARTGAVEFAYTAAPRRRSARTDDGPAAPRGWLRPDHSGDHRRSAGMARGAW